MPLRTIADNAGFEGHVVLRKVRERQGHHRLRRPRTATYGDMLEAGIIDPTKVTRSALQNAVSVATLLLTTDALIADAPKEDDGGRGARHAATTTMDY